MRMLCQACGSIGEASALLPELALYTYLLVILSIVIKPNYIFAVLTIGSTRFYLYIAGTYFVKANVTLIKLGL